VLRIIGVIVAVITVAFLLFNGTVMLVSPKAWFALPFWIRATGGLREEKYASGGGAVQVRIVGAIFLGGIGWVLYDSFFAH
jgi:hypothetical protein